VRGGGGARGGVGGGGGARRPGFGMGSGAGEGTGGGGARRPGPPRQGVEPTQYGRALLDCGAAVFDDLRQGVKNIEFLADPTAGEVRIGAASSLAASFVSSVIERLSRRHPRIVSHLVIKPVEALHRDLHDRNVELLIARSFGPLAGERWVSNSCLMTHMSSWRARKISGFGGAGLHLPSWWARHGRCRRRRPYLGRS